jgi:hypothetical protein
MFTVRRRFMIEYTIGVPNISAVKINEPMGCPCPTVRL